MTEPSNASPPADDEISLLDLLTVLAENARLLVFAPLAIGLAALGIAFTITPTFTATTTFLPPQQQQSTAALLASQLGGLAGLAGIDVSGLKNPADLYVSLLSSRTVADRMTDRFNLMQLYEVELRRDAWKALAGATKVVAGKDGLIVLEVTDEDPKRAADMANAYVAELARLTGGLSITDAQQRRVFFEQQLKTAQENLSKAQLALGEVGVPENLVKSSPTAVLEVIARLQALIGMQEIKLATMRGYLTEQSPEFRQAQRELGSLKTQLAQTERAQPAGSGQGAEYLNRFRDFKYQETLFELLAKQYESARLDEARENAAVQVVDKAVPPELKSGPKKARIAILATLSTGMFLVLFVVFREALRSLRAAPESATRLARIMSGLRQLAGRSRA